MTPEEKTAAVAVLDANIPASQSVGAAGRYTQVMPYNLTESSVTYTLRLDQYMTPAGVPDGVGYCRYITRPETGDADLINVYADPFGPSPWVSGWTQYRLDGI
jgi:hypothetical protein